MAKALHKVQKQISKKRGGKPNSLHENSRDAQRLRRGAGREEKLNRLLTSAKRANQVYVDRVAWFKAAMEESAGPWTEEEVLETTTKYVSRDDDELATVRASRRPGRAASSHEDQLRESIDGEKREFRSGFWEPDLREEESRSKLERWSGDWAGMNSLKFIRVTETGVIKPSDFPPKGLS